MTTAVAPPQPLPEPEQPSTQQLDDDPNVQSAIRFLQDPRVKASQVESQIRFLKGKSMSDAQIRHAFAKVGRAVTAEKVASVRAAPPINTAAAMAAPLQPQQSQTLFPRLPRPPQEEETQAKGVDWRDVVIGTGAAIIASVAGYKLFNRYSPYEIRRKSERKPPRSLRGAGRPRLPYHGSSESEMEGSGYPPQQRLAPPLPPPPTAVAPAAGPATTTAAAPGADAEELKKLQAQLDEAKEALTNERKKCADLAVGSAKIRAEKQQLSRANDRLTQQVEALKKDVEKLEAEKAAAAAGGETLTATEEEPPKPFYPSLTVDAEQARAEESPVTTTSDAAPAAGAAAVAAAMAAAAATSAAAAAASPPPVEAAPAPSPIAADSAVAPPAAAESVTAAASPAVESAAPVVPPVTADAAAGAPEEAPAVAIPAAFLTPETMKVDGAGVGPGAAS